MDTQQFRHRLHEIGAGDKRLGHGAGGAVKVAKRIGREHFCGALGGALGALATTSACGIFLAAAPCTIEVGHPLPVLPTRWNGAPRLSIAAGRAAAERSLASASNACSHLGACM